MLACYSPLSFLPLSPGERISPHRGRPARPPGSPPAPPACSTGWECGWQRCMSGAVSGLGMICITSYIVWKTIGRAETERGSSGLPFSRIDSRDAYPSSCESRPTEKGKGIGMRFFGSVVSTMGHAPQNQRKYPYTCARSSSVFL